MTPTIDTLIARDLLEPAQRIAKSHGLTVEAMFTDRALPAPLARAEFYALLHEMGWSEAAIGRLVGKDHTTIGNALRRLGATLARPAMACVGDTKDVAQARPVAIAAPAMGNHEGCGR